MACFDPLDALLLKFERASDTASPHRNVNSPLIHNSVVPRSPPYAAAPDSNDVVPDSDENILPAVKVSPTVLQRNIKRCDSVVSMAEAQPTIIALPVAAKVERPPSVDAPSEHFASGSNAKPAVVLEPVLEQYEIVRPPVANTDASVLITRLDPFAALRSQRSLRAPVAPSTQRQTRSNRNASKSERLPPQQDVEQVIEPSRVIRRPQTQQPINVSLSRRFDPFAALRSHKSSRAPVAHSVQRETRSYRNASKSERLAPHQDVEPVIQPSTVIQRPHTQQAVKTSVSNRFDPLAPVRSQKSSRARVAQISTPCETRSHRNISNNEKLAYQQAVEPVLKISRIPEPTQPQDSVETLFSTRFDPFASIRNPNSPRAPVAQSTQRETRSYRQSSLNRRFPLKQSQIDENLHSATVEMTKRLFF